MAQVVQACPKARDHLSPDGPQLGTDNVSATYVVTSLALGLARIHLPISQVWKLRPPGVRELPTILQTVSSGTRI